MIVYRLPNKVVAEKKLAGKFPSRGRKDSAGRKKAYPAQTRSNTKRKKIHPVKQGMPIDWLINWYSSHDCYRADLLPDFLVITSYWTGLDSWIDSHQIRSAHWINRRDTSPSRNSIPTLLQPFKKNLIQEETLRNFTNGDDNNINRPLLTFILNANSNKIQPPQPPPSIRDPRSRS